MAKQTINMGTAPTGAGGDTRRSAFAKCQSNFDELYDLVAIASGTNALGSFIRYSDGTQITWGNQTINRVVAAGTATSWSGETAEQPAPFVGIPHITFNIGFYTGAAGSGQALYGVAYTYGDPVGGMTTAVLNTGNAPAAVHPGFIMGTKDAASIRVSFRCMGRWK